jgi:hypothetical protein
MRTGIQMDFQTSEDHHLFRRVARTDRREQHQSGQSPSSSKPMTIRGLF